MQALARSPRTDARGFMAAVSGYVSSSEGAGGTKVRYAPHLSRRVSQS